jgi:hypothetical protein
MDKLKPILEQRFWILSGLAIILTFVGWSMGKSSLAAAIQSRRDKLKTAFDSVAGSGANPNEKWTQQVAQRNVLQEKELKLSYEQLYLRQQAMKFWPEGISEPARADITKATQTDVEIYRAKYVEHVDQVRQMIQPVEETEEGEIVGKVAFPLERMTVVQKANIWQNVAPTPPQVYEAQEDLWLYANLFTAIAKINESASGQFDATVREVYELRIRGGDPANIGTTSAPATSSMGDSSGAAAEPGMHGAAMPGGAAPMMGQASNSKYNTNNVDFNPDDEFGPDGAGNAAQGMNQPSTPSSFAADPAMAGAPGGQTEAAPIKRYIHETPQYKTRGFYMKVAIDHRRLPDFLAGLTNAPWGIRITRVHQMDMQPDDLVEAAGNATGGFAAGMPAGSATGFPGASSPLAAGHGGAGFPGAGASSSFPGSGTSSGFPGAGAAPGLAAPGLAAPGMGGVGAEAGGINPASNTAAMADPDLAIVAVDGWIVMYLPPAVDPNAAPPAEAPAADPAAPAAAPAAIESGAPPAAPAADAAPAAEANPAAPATPATPETPAAPPATPDPAAPAPATPAPATETPPADAPATPAPATPAEPKAAEPKPAEPPPN